MGYSKILYSLTTPQKAIWHTEQTNLGTNINNIACTYEFKGNIDKELLDKLSQESEGALMLEEVKVAIVTIMLPAEHSPLHAPQDLAAATQNILLAATKLGIGSVWIGVYPSKKRMEYIEKKLKQVWII